MPSVFNQNTIISRAVSQPATDYQVPPVGGNFSLANIKTTTALANNTGVDCKLIHGERYQYVDGVQTTYISSDCDETINGNWNLQVNGSTNLVFIGAYNSTSTSTTTTHKVGTVFTTEADAGFMWTPYQFESVGFFFEIIPVEIMVTGLELLIGIIDLTVAAVDLMAGIVVEEEKVLHAKETAEKLALESMKIDIGLLQDGVIALWAGVKPRVNGAPDIASAQIPPVLP
jgi:hypothetical protein